MSNYYEKKVWTVFVNQYQQNKQSSLSSIYRT